MADYDFTSLTDRDFESLVRDLLSKDLDVNLRGFKKGKDKGIDIRYSSNSNINKVVVQAKHYAESGYSALINNLKIEKEKVGALNAERYILATSSKLLPQHENEILKLFSPFLQSANDIYSQETLSRLLSENNLIERKHFKLWMSSASIFQRIINNAEKGSSEFYESKIRREIKRYVKSKALDTAMDILKKHKILMITGQPGVGKSTLADMIIYTFLGKDYELIYAGRNINDVKRLVDIAPDGKQIFYLDDFLGATYFDIINPKSDDATIVDFIDRIQQTKNRYLILTTRTTILNVARQTYEKFERSNIEASRHELELKIYTDLEKAQILYNHIYHSQIPKEHLKVIFQNKNYFKIIKHKNFNPRLIESVTDSKKFTGKDNINYFQFVLSTLENPEEVWKHSFKNQIIEDDRLLLFTVFTFGSETQENVLECAFEKRVKYEVANHGFKSDVSIYQNSLARLLDGHLKRIKIGENTYVVSFVNPSLSDYLIHYLKKSADARKRLLHSIVYTEQMMSFYTSVLQADFFSGKYKEEQRSFVDWLEKADLATFHNYGNHQAFFRACIFLSAICKFSFSGSLDQRIDQLIVTKLSSLPLTTVENHDDFLYLMIPIIRYCSQKESPAAYVRSNWDRIVKSLWSNVTHHNHIEQITDLFSDYNMSLDEFVMTSPNRELVQEKMKAILNDKFTEDARYGYDSLTSRKELDTFRQTLEDDWSSFYKMVNLMPEPFDGDKFLGGIDDALLKANASKNDTNMIDEVKEVFGVTSPKKPRNYDKAIEALFED